MTARAPSAGAAPAGRVLVEICVDTVDGARRAADAGADRIELCADLACGGVTPSASAIEAARAVLDIPLMVMVRPREGDFVYDAAEIAAMETAIDTAHRLGADGVVFGALTHDREVDRASTARLLARARPLAVTFHRAFDEVREPHAALEVLVRLGVDRVLTSAGADAVIDAVEALEALVRAAADRIAVMPGGGVRAREVRALLARTRAREVHSSAGRAPDGTGPDPHEARALVAAVREHEAAGC